MSKIGRVWFDINLYKSLILKGKNVKLNKKILDSVKSLM